MEIKIYQHDVGHITKMAAKTIYGKNPSKILFSGISGRISMKISLKHRGLQPIIACSYHEPGLTLT